MSYGNLVIVDHGNGKQTYYGHCSSVLVSAGDKVYQGQPIAKVGSTGRSTGNHCHFEVKINGTSVNPLSYLS
ncbi:MAG: M23 family metallopeptidase [Flavonifractor plautii]